MPAPEKYRSKIAEDKKICVIGSVDGVSIAPTIVEPKTTYFHISNICLPDTTFNKPRII